MWVKPLTQGTEQVEHASHTPELRDTAHWHNTREGCWFGQAWTGLIIKPNQQFEFSLFSNQNYQWVPEWAPGVHGGKGLKWAGGEGGECLLLPPSLWNSALPSPALCTLLIFFPLQMLLLWDLQVWFDFLNMQGQKSLIIISLWLNCLV